MKASQDRDGFRDVGGRIQRQKSDPRGFQDYGLEDGESVHGAGGDVELSVAAQCAGQQLSLHSIGVRDEDTNGI
jgi:hypothetical protein